MRQTATAVGDDDQFRRAGVFDAVAYIGDDAVICSRNNAHNRSAIGHRQSALLGARKQRKNQDTVTQGIAQRRHTEFLRMQNTLAETTALRHMNGRDGCRRQVLRPGAQFVENEPTARRQRQGACVGSRADVGFQHDNASALGMGC